MRCASRGSHVHRSIRKPRYFVNYNGSLLKGRVRRVRYRGLQYRKNPNIDGGEKHKASPVVFNKIKELIIVIIIIKNL